MGMALKECKQCFKWGTDLASHLVYFSKRKALRVTINNHQPAPILLVLGKVLDFVPLSFLLKTPVFHNSSKHDSVNKELLNRQTSKTTWRNGKIWQLWGKWDWITSTAWWPGCRSSCTSRSQVAPPERSQEGTNSKEDTADEQHKPREPPSKQERLQQFLGARTDEQEGVSRNTRPPLSGCQCWAGAGSGFRERDHPTEMLQEPSSVPGVQLCWRGPTKAPTTTPPSPWIMKNSHLRKCFERVWTAPSQASPSRGHWPSAPNLTPQAKRNQTMGIYSLLLQSPEITHIALFQALE